VGLGWCEGGCEGGRALVGALARVTTLRWGTEGPVDDGGDWFRGVAKSFRTFAEGAFDLNGCIFEGDAVGATNAPAHRPGFVAPAIGFFIVAKGAFDVFDCGRVVDGAAFFALRARVHEPTFGEFEVDAALAVNDAVAAVDPSFASDGVVAMGARVVEGNVHGGSPWGCDVEGSDDVG